MGNVRDRKKLFAADIILFIGLTLFLSGCGFSPISYLITSGVGEAHVLTGTVPLEAVLTNPDFPAETRDKIQWVQQVREYAQNTIGLAAGASYLGFYDTGQNAAIYSLSASRRDALEPYTWCIPVEGEVEALGYFYENLAKSYAEQLRLKGYDAVVYGSLAYSTEGLFADPLYSSLLELDKPILADAVIHEIAHNTIFMASNSDYNESVANFVGKKGALAFIESMAGKDSELYRKGVDEEADDDLVTEFLGGVYKDLATFYNRTDLTSEEKIAQREEIFLAHEQLFQTDYLPRFHYPEKMKKWGDLPVNNAWILLNRRYNTGRDLFEQVLAACNQNLNLAVGVFIQATSSTDPWQYLQSWLNSQSK